MYVKIKMIEVVPGQYGNVLVVKQVHAIDEAGKYIKAVKLTKNLAERIKDSPILIEQTEDVENILAKEDIYAKWTCPDCWSEQTQKICSKCWYKIFNA